VFSYDDRMRAVLLYIKYDRRAAATVRDLGYPTTKTLKKWYREYVAQGDLQVTKTREGKFTSDEARVAVDYYLEHGRCISATVRALGYPSRETLRQWIQERCPAIRATSVQRRRDEPFSEEEKRHAVIDLCARDGSATSVARMFGVSRTHLYTWRRQLLGEDAHTVKKTPGRHPDPTEREKLQRELEDLQKRVHRLQLEHDILVKANELLQKDRGINLGDLTNREKTLLIDALRATYRVRDLLDALSMARSSYFYHLARLQLPDRYQEVRTDVGRIFKENRRVYGYRRIHMMFRRVGTVVSEKVIRRIMAEEKLVVISRRRRRYSAYQGEITPAVANILQRDFHAQAPSEKWLTDITEFQVSTSKVYLSPVIDCFDGMVVSWTIGTRPDAELVNRMLDLAVTSLGPTECPVVHSDRGSHYRWPGWIERMTNAGLTRSMSKKGCTPDNAACEGFFGRLKSEMYYNRSWRGVSVERFIEQVDEYIRWYNEKRIKLSLEGMSPVEYRAHLSVPEILAAPFPENLSGLTRR
jgi:putative transposase